MFHLLSRVGESADCDAEVLETGLIAGEGVEVLEEDASEGMSCVRTAGGSEGWLRTAHLKDHAAGQLLGDTCSVIQRIHPGTAETLVLYWAIRLGFPPAGVILD